MHADDNGFDLTVTLPATQWAYTRRRLSYLEAVILQILLDPDRIKEWFSAGELATLRLRGLPWTRQGVYRTAKAQHWLARTMSGRGGLRQEFHCTALPDAAFADLLHRMAVRLPAHPRQAMDTSRLIPPTKAAPLPANAAPPWMLPLVRCLRGSPSIPLREAVQTVSAQLPPGVILPPQEEVEATLSRFGYVT